MAFKKGDPNINREGRPRKGESLPDLLEKILAEQAGTSDFDKREALCRQMIKLAFAGESWAVREVFDRLYGKPRQVIDQTNHNLSVVIDSKDADAVT
jgi:hypothetical protein